MTTKPQPYRSASTPPLDWFSLMLIPPATWLTQAGIVEKFGEALRRQGILITDVIGANFTAS